MEEKVTQQSQEIPARGGSGGRILGLIGIVIAIIALVIALSNVGVKEQLAKLQGETKKLAAKEESLEKRASILETKAAEAELLSALDRIYVLTMVERNYRLASAELSRVEGIYSQLKSFMDKDKVAAIDDALSVLKAEIERGPSPIPSLIAKLRSEFSTGIVVVSKPVAEAEKEKASEEAEKKVEKAEKKAEKPEKKAEEKVEKKSEVKSEKAEKKAAGEAKEEKKVEITKPKKEAKEAEKEEASGLKSAYLFWKRIGEKLAK